jgi:sugar lactone lactonase YvrE
VSGTAAAIVSLGADQLLTSRVVDPAISIVTPSGRLSAPGGIAFDAAGTLWVVSQTENALLGFAAGTISASGQANATVVINPTNSAIVQPVDVAFDSHHRLWVANGGNGTLIRYDSAQLVTSGATVPAVTISGLTNPGAIAFDASGALWASDPINGRLVRYDPNQLEQSGEPQPAVILDKTGTSLVSPRGIAFDRAGRLWVANAGNRTVVAFAPGQLGTSGRPEPVIVLSPTLNSLQLPVGVAFDAGGNLWVANSDGFVEEFDAATINASAAQLPTVHLEVLDKKLIRKIAFWPKPTGFPLN